MQILLNTQATIIKIDSRYNKIQNVEDFISLHYNEKYNAMNNMNIKYSPENHYHHVFLLKWFYSLYTKSHNLKSPKLKEVLLERINKPIIIQKKIENKKNSVIHVELIRESVMLFKVMKSDEKVFTPIYDYMKKKKISTFLNDNMELCVNVKTQENKNYLKSLLTSFLILDSKISFTVSASVETFLSKNILSDELENAYTLLESSPNEPLKSIKKRFKKLLCLSHPDRVSHKSILEVEKYTEKFKLLQNAFHLIEEKIAS